MKKKLVSTLLCVAMVGTMVAGCGGKGSDSASKKGDNVEINMFISQPEYADAINELIDAYKEEEPNVTINYETTQNDYPTLLKAKLNSGECPDIFASASGKEIETYKEYSLDMSDQPLNEVMLPAVQDAMKDGDGQGMHGLAIKGNYFGLVYNKELFEKAGIAQAPKTITELNDCIAKLKAADITPFTSGFGEWWVFKHLYQHFIGEAVEDYSTFVQKMEKGEESLNNYPLLKDGFFDYVDMIAKNGDAKPLETDLSGEQAAFAGEKAAMMIGQGAWVEADILKINPEIKIGFSGYPVDEDAKHCQVITGADQALRVNKDSKNKQEVLDFVNWWYTSDYGTAWFTDVAGVVPPIQTEAESKFEIIKQGDALVETDGSSPLGVIYSTDSFHTAFGEAMQAYVEGGASKEETIKAIEKKWMEIDGTSK